MIAGNFSVFPFLSVLQMLMSSGRTGMLEVTGERSGKLWLSEGTIIHAEVGELQGERAIQLLTTTDAGHFEFDGSNVLPKATLDLSGDLALRQLFQDTEAWKPYLAEYGDWTRGFEFTSAWDERRVVNQPQFWVLRGVERGLSIGEIMEQVNLPPRQLLGTLQQFHHAGLIAPA